MFLLAGSGVSMFGARSGALIYPLLALTLGGSAAAAGLIGFAAAAPSILFFLAAGSVADHRDKRAVLLGCQVGRCVTVSVFVILLVLARPGLFVVGMIAFAGGSFQAFYSVAERSIVPEIVSREQLTGALGRNETRNSMAALLGRPVGGFLFGLGQAVPFLAESLSYAFSVATLMLMPKQATAAGTVGTRTARDALRDITAGLQWLARHSFPSGILVLFTAGTLLANAATMVLLVSAHESGMSSAGVGVLVTGPGIGGVAGGIIAPYFQRRFGTVLIPAQMCCWTVAFIIVLIDTSSYTVFAAMIMVGFTGAVGNVSFMSYLVAAVPKPLFTQVISVDLLGETVAVAAAPLLGGLLISSLDADASFTVLSIAIFLISALILFLYLRNRRDLTSAGQ
jgi:MFS family permease